MRNKKIRIATNKQNWYDFDLVRGHAFGMFDGKCYVTGAEPDPRRANSIFMYERSQTINVYRWKKISVRASAPLAKAFLSVLANSPYEGVEYQEPVYRPGTNWKQPHHAQTATIERHERRTDTVPVWYDDTPWRPGFPTFRSHRPDAMPVVVASAPGKSAFIDRICGEVLSR